MTIVFLYKNFYISSQYKREIGLDHSPSKSSSTIQINPKPMNYCPLRMSVKKAHSNPEQLLASFVHQLQSSFVSSYLQLPSVSKPETLPIAIPAMHVSPPLEALHWALFHTCMRPYHRDGQLLP
eukprot:c21018_g2_i1 orf=57-428(-)